MGYHVARFHALISNTSASAFTDVAQFHFLKRFFSTCRLSIAEMIARFQYSFQFHTCSQKSAHAGGLQQKVYTFDAAAEISRVHRLYLASHDISRARASPLSPAISGHDDDGATPRRPLRESAEIFAFIEHFYTFSAGRRL